MVFQPRLWLFVPVSAAQCRHAVDEKRLCASNPHLCARAQSARTRLQCPTTAVATCEQAHILKLSFGFARRQRTNVPVDSQGEQHHHLKTTAKVRHCLFAVQDEVNHLLDDGSVSLCDKLFAASLVARSVALGEGAADVGTCPRRPPPLVQDPPKPCEEHTFLRLFQQGVERVVSSTDGLVSRHRV